MNETLRPNDTHSRRGGTHRPSPAQRLVQRVIFIGGGITIALIFLGVYALSWVVVLDPG